MKLLILYKPKKFLVLTMGAKNNDSNADVMSKSSDDHNDFFSVLFDPVKKRSPHTDTLLGSNTACLKRI